MPKIAKLFARYGITPLESRRPKPRPLKQSEEMIARAVNAFSLKRPKILLDHDARVLAALMEESQNANRALILCTWDKLHFWILENEDPLWDALDPSVLGDILSLISPELADAPIASATV